MKKVKTITLELINGYTINAIKGDYITNEILQHGIYEKPLFLFLQSVLKGRAFNCIDVGANIGVVSLTMCKYGNKVASFEPIPQLYELLKASIKDNQINNCCVHNVGLSNKKTTASFFVQTDGNIGSSTLSPKVVDQYKSELTINLEPGDENKSIKSLDTVDLIKIDVEGHEPEVVLGLRKTIQRDQPIIIVEWDNDSTRSGFEKHQIFESICSNYSVYYLCNRMSAFRRYTKKNKFLAPFRSPLRLLYKLIMKSSYKESPVLLSDFDRRENYGTVVLIPESKLSIIDSTIFY